MKDIKIIIATHKKYNMPKDKMYLPLHVGREGKCNIGYVGDNTGPNISNQNNYFNELTGLYWAWKNLDCDYIGLVHYRRYFTMARFFKKNKYSLILSQSELEKLLTSTDIILPAKRKYYIETIESHYRHLPYTVDEDLDVLRQLILTEYEEYLPAFEKVMSRRWAHMFNMFVMQRDYLNEYCEWAFSVLMKVDKRIHHDERTAIQNRAYISEFLIDTWIETKGYQYIEMPVLFIEKQHFFRKVYLLIKRKVMGNGN